MSVELRIIGDRVECDWGVFDNTDGNPDREFQHLILVTNDWLMNLLQNGPQYDKYGSLCSATMRHSPDELFFTAERGGQRWVWKLFDAHWWDEPAQHIFVGSWMD